MTPRVEFEASLLGFGAVLEHLLACKIINLTVPQFSQLSAEKTNGETGKLSHAWYRVSNDSTL